MVSAIRGSAEAAVCPSVAASGTPEKVYKWPQNWPITNPHIVPLPRLHVFFYHKKNS